MRTDDFVDFEEEVTSPMDHWNVPGNKNSTLQSPPAVEEGATEKLLLVLLVVLLPFLASSCMDPSSCFVVRMSSVWCLALSEVDLWMSINGSHST